MSVKKGILLGCLICFVVSASFIGAFILIFKDALFLAYNGIETTKEITNDLVKTPTVLPDSFPQPDADYLTYTSKLGFSFKYPKGWEVSNIGDNGSVQIKSPNFKPGIKRDTLLITINDSVKTNKFSAYQEYTLTKSMYKDYSTISEGKVPNSTNDIYEYMYRMDNTDKQDLRNGIFTDYYVTNAAKNLHFIVNTLEFDENGTIKDLNKFNFLTTNRKIVNSIVIK